MTAGGVGSNLPNSKSSLENKYHHKSDKFLTFSGNFVWYKFRTNVSKSLFIYLFVYLLFIYSFIYLVTSLLTLFNFEKDKIVI